MSALYSTKNLNFTLVILDANMSETSFCQNLLADVTINSGKLKEEKKKKTPSVEICCLSSANIM